MVDDFELESRRIQYQLMDELATEDFIDAFESDELFDAIGEKENVEDLELVF